MTSAASSVTTIFSLPLGACRPGKRSALKPDQLSKSLQISTKMLVNRQLLFVYFSQPTKSVLIFFNIDLFRIGYNSY